MKSGYRKKITTFGTIVELFYVFFIKNITMKEKFEKIQIKFCSVRNDSLEQS